jgi:tRNA U34 2-thiouridine synthase MnmA/TrmU
LPKHFSIGDLQKSKVRDGSFPNLITAGKKDSQGLCFIGGAITDFLVTATQA